MKTSKPRVVRDFRGQDYVQTSNVCGNTTYVRNYQVEYLLSLAPEHVNKLLTSLSENDKLDRYLHREQVGQSLANIASTCAYSAIWYGLQRKSDVRCF